MSAADHPLSLAFLTLPDTSPPRMIEAAARAGFAAVGLRLLPAAASDEGPYPLLTDNRLLAETRAALRDTRLIVADVEIIRLNQGFQIDATLPFLHRAAELGARHVLVAGDDRDEARLTDSFAAFCAAAAEFGMTADLEFMPWTAVPDLPAARRIVAAAQAPNAGLLIDALHYDRAGATPDQVRDLPRDWINYAQFCDGPADYDRSEEGLIAVARGGRLMPGAGGIDLTGLARAIPPGVMISVEVADRSNRLSPEDTAQRAALCTRAVLDAA
ncbi:MAG: TIM barrel protein [Paracoccus sp. (in: a-proteobacteria)]|uniref:sugar phosphate isomerase/epimerase family protein n=1 Tax=Paracoccus sp. TaxID=267 RepID=UPI0026E02755|nr:TIM barrel protein [Paracoccus sp. (in: a-proteobacteria)]MDO5631232.1 TIM barrel protein [Paracoccus sp. (in: a-proteobacteria)]